MRHGLSTEKRAWAAVVLYTVFLYGTMTLVFDLYVSLYDRIGRETMSTAINLTFLVVGMLLLAVVLRGSTNRAGSLLAFLLIVLATAFCLKQLTVPAKRIHFFQYAPLTLLIFHAVSFRSRDRYRYVWTLSLVALLGLGDEALQGLLPKRLFGLSDVVVNTVAGMLTLSFLAFVLPRKKEEGEPRITNARPKEES